MAEAPAVTPLGAATLNRDWRLEVDTGVGTGGPVATVTATSGNAVLASTAHGLVANQPVSVTSAVAPFVNATVYYVSATNLAANTFSLSATPGGAVITPSAGGTLGLTKGPVWTVVRGRTDFTPGVDNTLQEDSDMDSTGWKSQTKTAAQWTLAFKVVRKAIASVVAAGSTSTYDPGQEALRIAADQIGPYNSVSVRWFKLGAVRTEAYQGNAAVAWSPDGGGMDGLDTASVTLTGQGPRVAITHPYTLP